MIKHKIKIIVSVLLSVLLALYLIVQIFHYHRTYETDKTYISKINTAGLVFSIYYVINYDTVINLKDTKVSYSSTDKPYLLVHKNKFYVCNIELGKSNDTYELVLPYSYSIV